VQTRLDAAIASFVSMRLSSGPGERDVLLSDAAAALEEVYLRLQYEARCGGLVESEAQAAGFGKAQMLSLLAGIRSRASQLQQLNEAAIGLCRGWLSAAPFAPGEYTPEGVATSVPEVSGMPLRA
jgi:hypothetical protein